MADDFLIRIIPEGFSGGISTGGAVSSGASPSVSGTGGGLKGAAGIFGTVLKGLGIASGIGVIVAVISSMKNVVNIVAGVIKIIGALLRPISTVITTLLMPILFSLKPLVILINQVMAPFTRLAMDMFRQGVQAQKAGDTVAAGALFGGAIATTLAGLSAVFIAVAAETIKMTIGQLLDIIQFVTTPVIKFLTSMTDEQIAMSFQMLKDGVNSGIDLAAGAAVLKISSATADIADRLGVDTSKFRSDAKTMISNVFSGAEGKEGLNKIFTDQLDAFGRKGSDAVRKNVDMINREWDRLSERNSSQVRESFAARQARIVAENSIAPSNIITESLRG